MKLEDPTETWDFFMKSAGESYVTHVDSFQVDQGSVSGTYQDAKGARVEKRQRIDLLDLKEQREGEAHFFFKSKIVRGKFFFANPKPVKQLRLNHFLKIGVPDDDVVRQMVTGLNQFQSLIDKGVDFSVIAPLEDEVETTAATMSEHSELILPIERSINLFEKNAPEDDFLSFFFDESDEEQEVTHLDIFMPLKVTEHVERYVVTDSMDTFKRPLLNRTDVRDQVEYIQRLCGSTSQKATNIAMEFISDLERGTRYPPVELPPFSGEELAELLGDLTDAIAL